MSFHVEWLAGLPMAVLAVAAQAQTPEVEQRLSEEVQLALVRMIESGAFAGTATDAIAFTLDEPARRVTDLGMVVDSATAERAKDGLRLLAVTPRGTAQRLGLRAGDRVVAVNGIALTALGADASGHAQAAITLRTTVESLADGAPLRFDVVREGRELALNGVASSVTLPPIHLKVGRDELLADTSASRARRNTEPDASAGCGHISVFDVAPRQQKLYAARLLSIDDQLAGPTDASQFRLSAGTHTLKVAELIEDEQLSFNSRQRLGNSTKSFNVTIKANTTYYLAAHLIVDQRSSWKDGAYWEPVLWKEAPADCR